MRAGQAQHPVYTLDVLAHEYGHAIFEENLGLHTDLLEESHQLLERRTHLEDELKTAKERLQEITIRYAQVKASHERASQEGDLVAKKGYATEGNALSDEWKITSEKADSAEEELFDLELKLGFAYDKILPYHELFADVIAVLRTGNGKANAQSFTGELQARLRGRTLKKGRRENSDRRDIKKRIQSAGEFRDFKKRLSPEGWDGKNGQVLLDGHIVFSPVRSFIWSNYMTNIAYAKDPGKIAKTIFNGIVKELGDLRSIPGSKSYP